MENSKNNTTIKGIKRKHNFFKKLDKICCENQSGEMEISYKFRRWKISSRNKNLKDWETVFRTLNYEL